MKRGSAKTAMPAQSDAPMVPPDAPRGPARLFGAPMSHFSFPPKISYVSLAYSAPWREIHIERVLRHASGPVVDVQVMMKTEDPVVPEEAIVAIKRAGTCSRTYKMLLILQMASA
jgi:hypothetical protein